MDFESFKQVIDGFSSSDNEYRNSATHMFNSFGNSHPQELVKYLLQYLNINLGDNSHQMQCAVLLRKKISDSSTESTNIWDQIPQQIKNEAIDELFKCLVQHTDDKIRQNLCIAISEIASRSDESSSMTSMNQIMPKIFDLIRTSDYGHQKSALRILGDIIPWKDDFVKPNLEWLNPLIQTCMNSPEFELRYQCLGFLENLFNQNISTNKIVNCVPTIIETLKLMAEVDHPLLPEFLQCLIQIAENKAEYFKKDISTLNTILASIAMNTGIDESNRPLALEVLVCIVECKPILTRKVPNFIEKVIEVTLHFMLDITDAKYQHWFETGEEHDYEDQYIYYNGLESIDRLAKALSADKKNTHFFPTVFRFLQEFLENPKWEFNYVGIMCISQIAEYFPEENSESYLERIIALLINKLQDQDWRVRFAACQAIGQISLDHQPYVQENFHAEVLSSLSSTLNDFSPRVQAHSLAAFINFAEEVTKSALNPHVEYIMQHLLARITNQTSILVREQAVSAIAVIAGVIGADFMKYQDIMPLIMSIVEQCVQKGEQVLRGKAIECITIIGISVGHEKFREYSKVTMDALMQLNKEGIEDDNPVREFVQQSTIRLCGLMEDDFIPYIPDLLPELLKIISEQPDYLQLQDSPQDSTDMSPKYDPDTYLMETSHIQDQEHAFEFIRTAAEVLKAKFADYIEPCTRAVLNFLENYLYLGLQAQSLSAMASLIQAARSASDINGDRSFVLQMLTRTSQSVFVNISNFGTRNDAINDLELIIAEANGLEECLNKAGPGILSVEMVKHFSEKVFELLHSSSKRRDNYKNIIETGEEDDEDDALKIENDIDLELDLSMSLTDILGTLMQHHKQEFFNSSIQISTDFIQAYRQLGATGNTGAILLASLLCSDILEYLGEFSIPFWHNLILPFTFDCIKHEDSRIRQSANYTLGKAAQIPDFRPYANESAKSLWAASQNYVNLKPFPNQTASDNAFASLGDIIFNHYDAIEQPTHYVQGYLTYLPLKDDHIEGKRVHNELMERFKKNDPKLLGPDGAFKEHVMAIFVEIYKTQFSTDDLDNQISQLFSEVNHQNLEVLFANPSKTQIRQLNTLTQDLMANHRN